LFERSFWTLPKIALGLIAIFLVDRIIYFLLVPFGYFEKEQAADIIFSELPALLFFSIYCLVVIRWAEIYHFTMTSSTSGTGIHRLSPAVIAANIFMYLSFIILFIIFLAIPSGTIEVTCATGYQAKVSTTAPGVVSTVYNILFAVVCVLLAFLYTLYGYRVIFIMKESGKGAAKNSNKNNKYLRLVLVSAVCTLALLVQAALLIQSSFGSTGSRSVGQVVPIILVSEVLPTLIFLFMFNKASNFTKKKRSSTITLSAEDSGTRANEGTYRDSIRPTFDNIPLTPVQQNSTPSDKAQNGAKQNGTDQIEKVNLESTSSSESSEEDQSDPKSPMTKRKDSWSEESSSRAKSEESED